MNPSNSPPPVPAGSSSPNPSGPPTAEPRPPSVGRRWGRIFLTFSVLFGLYLAFSLLNSHSLAQWKWAAALDALESGRVDEAQKLADEALEWAPEDPEFRLHYAEMLFRLDQPQEARVQIDKAIELGRDDPALFSNLAFLLARMGQHDGSLLLADQVVEMAEKERTIHLHQALNQRAYMIALAAADEEAPKATIQKGLRDIERAIELYGEEPSYIDTRGYLKLFAGNHQGALDDLDAAIEAYELLRDRLLSATGAESVDRLSADATAQDKMYRGVLAVLYAHRAAVYAQMGKDDLAEKDQTRAKSFGLDRQKGIW